MWFIFSKKPGCYLWQFYPSRHVVSTFFFDQIYFYSFPIIDEPPNQHDLSSRLTVHIESILASPKRIHVCANARLLFEANDAQTLTQRILA
jgi:hypothetical protein